MTTQEIKDITTKLRSDIQAILPAGYTIGEFFDGGGTYGISYYASIRDEEGHYKMVRISDHISGATSSPAYICGSWNFSEKLVEKINHYFNYKPSVHTMTAEFPREKVLLMSYPNAFDIVKGELVRISKSGNEIFSFTFNVLK